MPKPKDRSRSMKRKNIRIPSGKSVIRYKRDLTPGTPKCAICKKKLGGSSPVGSKTQKRAERPFGGVLCPSCLSKAIKASTRLKEKAITLEEVDISFRPYVEVLLK
ncbi:50S ribosomal protein L34e [Candidatus Micrarchaeota archaeon]|nr:50S ribosomal protein L34e [Candidatus Micrarchaeota archaeon]